MRRASWHQILLSLSIFLCYESHWKLPNINRMIRIMLATTDILISCLSCCLLVLVHQVEVYVVDHSLLLIHIMRPRSLNGSEPATANFVVV